MPALGNANFPNSPLYGMGAGIRTQFGLLSPPGARVAAYVRSTGVQSQDDPEIANRLFTTLNAGLAECRSGKGDIVFVMPEHVESINAADYMSSLVAGTRIQGLGYGTARPTFTWTVAGSTFLFDVANTVLDNCILNLEPGTGTVTVAAPITISAAGCQISNCRMRTSTDASNLTTIPIAATDAADDLVFVNNHMFGATAGECTTMLSFLGTDRLIMEDCYLEGATSSTTVGVLKFAATAATNIRIRNSVFVNRKASSIHAVTGVASLTGVLENNGFGILNDSLLVGFVTPGNTMGFRNYTVNLAGEQGGATTPIST